MVFPKDSKAEKKVKNLTIGKTMHVIGMPRISLALVSYRVEHSTENSSMLEWNLPVGMIVVAMFQQ